MEALEWFKNNSLIANLEKIQILLISPKDPNDRNLSFKKHITNLCISAKSKLKALQRIRKYLTLDQTKMIADAFIYSQFNYCIIIWVFCSKMDG